MPPILSDDALNYLVGAAGLSLTDEQKADLKSVHDALAETAELDPQVVVIDPITNAIVNSGLGEYGVLSLLILMLITVGMFLDGVSIFLIFVPLLMPIVNFYKWDPVWFGVILTLKVALGQFTPPLAVNLMVSCRIANVRMEDTVRQRLREDFDITLPRFDLMAQLEREPDGLSMGELSRRMMVTGGNVTAIVDQLEAEHLVQRQTLPGDRRAFRVSLR